VRRTDGAGKKELTRHSEAGDSRLAEWELTVGIEIHAQLNTARKLFSGKIFANL
jgi:aspartyl-tRNA(Asn)/glutamyl-tRNA(Gln) amidotransferase subunit B